MIVVLGLMFLAVVISMVEAVKPNEYAFDYLACDNLSSTNIYVGDSVIFNCTVFQCYGGGCGADMNAQTGSFYGQNSSDDASYTNTTAVSGNPVWINASPFVQFDLQTVNGEEAHDIGTFNNTFEETGTYYIRAYVNDASTDYTSLWSNNITVIVADFPPPVITDLGINQSGFVFEGMSINHTANISSGSDIDVYIFSWNGTNGCGGGWSNSSDVSVGATYVNASNISTIGGGCAGMTIGWKFYANTTGGWNESQQQNYSVYKYGYLNVSINFDNVTLTRNGSVSVNATVKCLGGSGALCGDVIGRVRYNSSGGSPDSEISTFYYSTPLWHIPFETPNYFIMGGHPVVDIYRYNSSNPFVAYGDETKVIDGTSNVGVATVTDMRDFGEDWVEFIMRGDELSIWRVIYNTTSDAWGNPHQLGNVSVKTNAPSTFKYKDYFYLLSGDEGGADGLLMWNSSDGLEYLDNVTGYTNIIQDVDSSVQKPTTVQKRGFLFIAFYNGQTSPYPMGFYWTEDMETFNWLHNITLDPDDGIPFAIFGYMANLTGDDVLVAYTDAGDGTNNITLAKYRINFDGDGNPNNMTSLSNASRIIGSESLGDARITVVDDNTVWIVYEEYESAFDTAGAVFNVSSDPVTRLTDDVELSNAYHDCRIVNLGDDAKIFNKTLFDSDVLNINFSINATGVNQSTWLVDVLFNSSLGNGVVPSNDTLDRRICIGGCVEAALPDSTPPSVYINLSLNSTGFSTKTPNIFFNFSDGNSSSANCTLYFNDTQKAQNISVLNWTLTNLTASETSAGRYDVWVNCTDLSGNEGKSDVLNVSIDVCFNIASSGSYVLNYDLLSVSNKYCINITSSDVVLDCEGHLIDGKDVSQSRGIYVTGDNVSVRGCNFTDWRGGISFVNVVNASLNDSVGSSNYYSFEFSGVNYSLMNNLTAFNDTYGGVLADIVSFSTFSNIVSYGHNGSGGSYGYGLSIELEWNDNNTVINSTFYNNLYGIYVYDARRNNITGNEFRNNTFGSVKDRRCRNCTYYNNLFNDSTYLVFFSTKYFNNWNISNQVVGTRIYSDGTNLGGNYWTNSSNDGFSDECDDNTCDGFCDSPFNISKRTTCTVGVDCSLNTDYFAYSNKYVGGGCGGGDTCTYGGAGNWDIDCGDMCNISSTDVQGNNVNISGSSVFECCVYDFLLNASNYGTLTINNCLLVER